MKKTLLAMLFLSLFAKNGLAQDPEVSAGGKMETATFAGGCFWCMEASLEKIPGVISVVSGYTGGQKEDPTYEEVGSGTTGHYEAVEVTYDPAKVTYQKILDVFWQNIDPTVADGQFSDKGTQYRTAIFYHNEEQKQRAEDSKKRYDATGLFGKPIVTGIIAASKFYPAEEHHQDYSKKNPTRYKMYKIGSGRQEYIEKMWGTDAGH